MHFYSPPAKTHLKKERLKAKRLKSSKWWKQKLLEGMCYYCRKSFSPEHLTMDHKVPLARGGVSSRSNIVVACEQCNRDKSTQTSVDVVLDQLKMK